VLEHYLVIAVIGVAAIVALTSVGAKLGVAPPLVLIGVGIALSLLPFVPDIRIPSDVILIGLLPPLLYASAVSVPVVEFRRDMAAVGALAVILVVGSSVLLGVVVHLFLPEVPLPICVALGAVVAPTDAVATTIVKRLGVSPRVVTMLDGESLFNDATALVLLRATTAGGAVGLSLIDITVEFVVSAVVAALVGGLVGWLALTLRQAIVAPAPNTAISFITPFVAYVPAEELGASGLVAVVVAGLVSNLMAPHRLDTRHRLNEEANWKTAQFLLEGVVFLIMGLQLKTLVGDVVEAGDSVPLAIGLGGLCIAGSVVIRAVFVAILAFALDRRAHRKVRRRKRWETASDAVGVDLKDPQSWSPDDASAIRLAEPTPPLPSGLATVARHQRRWRRQFAHLLSGRSTTGHPQERQLSRWKTAVQRYLADVDYLTREPLGAKESVLLVWAGMRGVVTLAAGQTLAGKAVQDDLLILIAFVVAAGSMLIQGSTLAWLAKVLKLTGQDSSRPGEAAALNQQLGQAALSLLDDPDLRQASGEPYDLRVLGLVSLGVHIAQPGGLDQLEQPSASPDSKTSDFTVEDIDFVPDMVAAAGPEATARWADLVNQIRHRGDPDDPDPADAALPPLSEADRLRQYRELRLLTLHAMREALLEARSLGTYSHRTLADALAILDADEISLELKLDVSSQE
jgi:CPA1 family monovalent cation:H+ antiporter